MARNLAILIEIAAIFSLTFSLLSFNILFLTFLWENTIIYGSPKQPETHKLWIGSHISSYPTRVFEISEEEHEFIEQFLSCIELSKYSGVGGWCCFRTRDFERVHLGVEFRLVGLIAKYSVTKVFTMGDHL